MNSTQGLNYTLWKALAESGSVLEYLCVMMSLPFLYGFVNRRWLKMIDVMLEKKKGIRQIHMLRIIGLLEANFNTALKIYARRLMRKAELNGLSNGGGGRTGALQTRLCCGYAPTRTHA